MNFIIKPFDELSTHELYALLALRAEVFVVEQNCAYQDCDGRDTAAWHIWYEVEGTPLAYARVLPEGISYNSYCSIGRVVTHPAHRKQKYGKELMKACIEFCLQRFQSDIKISAQAYLEKFYSDLGFKTVSEPYLEDDIPHVAMILHLNE